MSSPLTHSLYTGRNSICVYLCTYVYIMCVLYAQRAAQITCVNNIFLGVVFFFLYQSRPSTIWSPTATVLMLHSTSHVSTSTDCRLWLTPSSGVTGCWGPVDRAHASRVEGQEFESQLSYKIYICRHIACCPVWHDIGYGDWVGYRVVTDGDFIVLPHCETRPPAPWPHILLSHIILTLS